MKLRYLAIGSLLAGSVFATAAEARTNSPRRPTSAAECKQAIQRCGSLAYARLEYLHAHSHGMASASCHPSRAAILTKNLAGGGTSDNRPADKRQLAVVAKHLSPVERRELARFWLVEANYQKYQQQRARKPPAMGGVDRPRDPWLDKLAREQEEREQQPRKGAE